MNITKNEAEGLRKCDKLGRKGTGRLWWGVEWPKPFPSLLPAPSHSPFLVLGTWRRKEHDSSHLLLRNLYILQIHKLARNLEVSSSTARQDKQYWREHGIVKPLSIGRQGKISAFETITCGFSEKTRVHGNGVPALESVKSCDKLTQHSKWLSPILPYRLYTMNNFLCLYR